MYVLSVPSQKGGSGKTTIAYCLATAASGNERTLIIDTDPQGSISQVAEQDAAFDVFTDACDIGFGG